MMGSVAMMYANHMISLEAIIISAFSGTLLGNTLNFLVGQYFSEKEFVKRKLSHPRVASARNLLESRGLFLFMLVSRFITFTRPLYAILLGSLGIKYYRFIIYELFIALFWVVFWLMIIVKGIDIYAWIFN
ncbi:VTT domain-containing protein [Candidatus Kaiserbacteria bacterium]|nr:VTT domain-containing protein [Candidatus Kaiserbacteria bacterium]